MLIVLLLFFFFSSRRRHTRFKCDWSSDVCSSDLMSRPRLLLLDEPSLGLAPLIVRAIFQIIRDLHAAGVTILLVEQNASLALQIADRAYVLEAGRLRIPRPAPALLSDERVQ